jgi:GT2 family glycosyltransferase/glycosyltransferase involved in cell wall biosynthesis
MMNSSADVSTEPTRKLSVLVVNGDLPMYDRMSGSLRLQRYLELMVAEGHHVTFIARAGYGQERYAEELRDLGVEVHSFDIRRLRACGWGIQGVGFDLPLLLKRGRFDVAFLSFYYTAEEYLPAIRTFSPATRIVIDTVDVHHVRERRGAELADDSEALTASDRTRAREAAIYSQADLLVAVSENDGHELQQLAPDVPVEVMSNVHLDAPAGPGFDERSGLVFVGNFSHTPNVDAILDFHEHCWPLVAQALPEARLTLVGYAPPPEVMALNGGRITVTGHVPEVQPFLDGARISVAPLRFGGGVKGKIGEALMHGLPVVTTPIGAEGMDLRDGESALVADPGEEFATAIIRLYRDQALWERLSEQGRSDIADRNSHAASLASLRRTLRAATPTCFVARASSWSPEAVAGLVSGYVGAFAESDPVSLIVPVTPGAARTEPDCEAVGAMFLDALTRTGADPEHIPDIAVMPSAGDPPLPSCAVLVHASRTKDAEHPDPGTELVPGAPAAITASADVSEWIAAANVKRGHVDARPLVSIIVPAYNKREMTETCLAALERDLGDRIGDDIELVLVDNGSSDSTAELFQEWSSRATVVTLAQNRNFAGGANAGAQASRGDVLVLVTNDVEVGSGAVDALVEEVRQPGVGLVGARLRYPSGRLQHGGFGWRRVPDGLVPFHLFHSESGSLPAARATLEIGAVTGACSAFRADLFRLVGGYDEGYVNGWEDIDLCLQIRSTGATIRYRGDVDIIHHEGVTAGGRYNEEGNPRRFFSRWGGMLWDDSSLLRLAFGASISPVIDLPDPGQHPHGAPVLLVGPVAGIGPESDEARGLLRALQTETADIAARTLNPTWIGPSLDELRWHELANAHTRAVRPDATTIAVGDYDADATGAPHVLRVGATVPSRPAGAVAWAACPAVRDALLQRGWPEEAIELVAPAGIESVPGSGGRGILVVAPTHDHRLTTALLEALRHVGGTNVRLLPTVQTPSIRKALRDVLPAAELLAPTTDERVVATLAAESDLVVALDPCDGFDRLALTAAAAGAAVAVRAGGPAAWVLGEAAIVVDPHDPSFLATTLGRDDYDTAPAARRARAAAVLEHCGPHATVRALRRLLAVAHAAA